MEPEEEADVGCEECDLLVHVDEAAAVHDAEAGEDQVGHQHEHDQDQRPQPEQRLRSNAETVVELIDQYKAIMRVNNNFMDI